METIEKPKAARPASLPRTLAITLKDKGGTGASFIARFLAEQYQHRKIPAHIVDGDGTTASLSRHFGMPRESLGSPELANPSNPVHTFSLHGSERERDEIANLLEVNAPRMLLDLPATSLTVLRAIERDYGWISLLTDCGWRATVIASITPFEETIFDLGDVMELFGDRADYVAVVNMGLAEERDDFELWDESQTKPQFLAAHGIELQFPRLKPRIAAKLQKHALTFEGGKTSLHIKLSDRSRLAKWYADAETALAPAASLLGL